MKQKCSFTTFLSRDKVVVFSSCRRASFTFPGPIGSICYNQLLSLEQLLSCKTRTHDKLPEAFAEAEDQRLLLSETMMAIRWESEVQQQLMCLNFDTALQLFIVDTDLDGKVNTLGLPHEDRVQCQSHVLTIIEDFVMS